MVMSRSAAPSAVSRAATWWPGRAGPRAASRPARARRWAANWSLHAPVEVHIGFGARDKLGGAGRDRALGWRGPVGQRTQPGSHLTSIETSNRRTPAKR